MLTNVLPRKVTPRNTKRTPQSAVLLCRHPRFAAREQASPSFVRRPSPEISVEIARPAVEISPASHAKRRMTSPWARPSAPVENSRTLSMPWGVTMPEQHHKLRICDFEMWSGFGLCTKQSN